MDRPEDASTHARRTQALDALLEHGAVAGVRDGQLLSLLDSGEHIDTISTLVGRELVAMEPDEFGEHRLSLLERGTFLKSKLSLAFLDFLPSRGAAAKQISHAMSKLELVAICIGNGWRIGPLLEKYSVDSPLTFSSAAFDASKWFWLVCSWIHRMFAKGIECIYSNMPAKYYEYVYRLRDPTKLNGLADRVLDMPHAHWCALLKGQEPADCPPAQLQALENGEGEDMDDEPQEDASTEHLPRPELQISASFSSVRPPIVFARLFVNGKTVRVLFDGESHRNGPRAYAVCPKHTSESCRKYEFIHHFSSLSECVVFLAAWQLSAVRTANQARHLPCEPNESEMDMARQHMPELS